MSEGASAFIRLLSAFICVICFIPAAAHARADVAARVEVAFTPGDDVAGLIVGRIASARQSVRMQAYLFTDRRIANALLGARRRGVEVEVIGDATQHAAGGLPHLEALDRAGARVYLNGAHAAMHNKIVIIDGDGPAGAVLTGSYNFTPSAQSRNAENLVVLSGSAVTRRFAVHFEQQRAQSSPWPSASTSRP